MKHNQWFAVRCCCTPKKVFGFIKLARPETVRLPYQLNVLDIMGREHLIKLMDIRINKLSPSCGTFAGSPPPADVMEYTMPEIAIYSDDRPIEFWRTIRGFVEATTED